MRYFKRIILMLIFITLTSLSVKAELTIQELIFDNNKTMIINDSKATNIESMVRAIKNYKNIYLICGGVLKDKNLNKKYPKMYDVLEKTMLERKNIHPNVDYPCGPTYHLMGIDTDFFTPVFVMARITGWSAHIMEQHNANKLIRPLSKYKGSEHREVLALNIR